MNIHTSMVKVVACDSAPNSTELKPAVRSVTDWNHALFSRSPMPMPASEPFHSLTSQPKNATPSSTALVGRTSFTGKLMGPRRRRQSSLAPMRTPNPIPPITISNAIVCSATGLDWNDTRLSDCNAQPALQNALPAWSWMRCGKERGS